MKFIELPQITPKGIGSDAREAIRQNQPVFLFRVYGEATAVKIKESKSGDPYTYLLGAFRAIAPQKDATVSNFQSERLYLPSSLQDRIESQVALARKSPVKFAYDVFSTPDRDVTSGYRYTYQSLMDAAPTDRVSEIGAALGELPAAATVAVGVAADCGAFDPAEEDLIETPPAPPPAPKKKTAAKKKAARK